MWDWIIMSIIYVCIATSLGEIASLYPVSGGVYYWSFMLSPPKHAPLVSWIVGWLSVIGNVVVTLSVNFATTQLILSSVNRKSPENSSGLLSDDQCTIPSTSLLSGILCYALGLCEWFPTSTYARAKYRRILLLGSIAILGQHYLVWVDVSTKHVVGAELMS
jgi:amino acid transporter